jgi:hypothetical protein
MFRTGWSPLLPVLFTIACAPPPAVTTPDTDGPPDPSVRIVFPPLSPQPEVALAESCDLAFDVAVDIDDFTYVPPGVEPDPVDGHGHYHLVGGAETPLEGFYVAPDAQLRHLDITDGDLQNASGDSNAHFSNFADTDQVFSIVAALVQNNHETIDCPTCRSTLEFTITKGECPE